MLKNPVSIQHIVSLQLDGHDHEVQVKHFSFREERLPYNSDN